VDDGYSDHAVRDLGGHRPAGPLRGGKYSLFEGGARVPLLVRWPGRVRPGVSDALVNQVDFLTSLASMTAQTLPQGSAPDSLDVLPALLGDSRVGRDHSVHHSGRLALREGSWKYIPAGPGPAVQTHTNTETGNAPIDQLYDLAHDLGETKNVAVEHPERIAAMAVRLRSIRDAGRSQP
jgi:arylsulfatase A-like enzyme